MFRISLRELFAIMACCALALTSLKYASDTWLAAVLGVAILALFVAIIFASADRGPRQAFSLAFVLIVIAYGWIVLNMSTHLPNQLFGGNSEFELWGGQLPTTRLLRHAYESAVHERWINSSTGLEIPNFDQANPSLPIGNLSGGGGGGMGASPTGPFAIHDVSPNPEQFARIGHLWWALLFGYVSGRFGQSIYVRRMKSDKE